MSDDWEAYHAQLEALLQEFGHQIELGEIKGEGAGQFLLVKRGSRGAELYRGDDNQLIVDPALEDELQGEMSFSTSLEATTAVLRWLNGGDRASLLQGAT